ncbi:unnamed protein product [Rotaria magnacalcarata]|uniref:EF-hand domain-containing protein n=1 Tax=Rotaria magnacalcarata TaxID=392030 RepID=A0A819M0B8_9BILA|nr:unnamed protein product [Rotaria magnacalcarata]CAF2079987.1 unnamed protein product [Rotaria magnacalcarata]CAF3971798.1 unnamed protein product [Rotaria magnacalcarata]CAF4189127.1 unnamed protein product [Rotaria magnacalcarata]
MAKNDYKARVDETIKMHGNRIDEVEYVYIGFRKNGEHEDYHRAVTRADYERVAATIQKPTLPFDKFIKVLRPFMMGAFAHDDIPEAFRLLDADHSGTIDIGELAAFMPAIVPNSNPYILLHHIQQVDKNNDFKLNLEEFTALIHRGIGRDITLGRL